VISHRCLGGLYVEAVMHTNLITFHNVLLLTNVNINDKAENHESALIK
jgi:hypothetical protein